MLTYALLRDDTLLLGLGRESRLAFSSVADVLKKIETSIGRLFIFLIMPSLSGASVFLLVVVAEVRSAFMLGWLRVWNANFIGLPINNLGFVFLKLLVYLAH